MNDFAIEWKNKNEIFVLNLFFPEKKGNGIVALQTTSRHATVLE